MRVSIAEDSVLRRSLELLLAESGAEVVASARTGTELLATLDPADLPQVVILDLRMPLTYTDEGVVTAATLRAVHPEIGVLLFSAHAEVSMASRLLELPGAGGLGYAVKDRVADPREFMRLLARVQAGEQFVDDMIVTDLFGRRRHAARVGTLSDRERQVMELMAAGHTNQSIGEHLHLAERTVDDHVSAIFGKLDLPRSASQNRRVLAAVTWLAATPWQALT